MSDPTNLYATDGLCHNSDAGRYGDECGAPATWLGISKDGWGSGFCDRCKEHGTEAARMSTWRRIEQAAEAGWKSMKNAIMGGR